MVNTTTETIGSFKAMFRLGFGPHPNLRAVVQKQQIDELDVNGLLKLAEQLWNAKSL
jgi:hypothetical protein